MNGASVPRLVEEFFQPISGVLDYTFAAGVAWGLEGLARFCWQCWRGFRVYCLPFGRCSGCDMKERFGEWAVIVGATSGIGQAYAEELAKRNMNVVLISRFYDDLVELVAKIQSESNVQAYGIHADFSLGRHVYNEINDALQGLQVGILVNDAAVQYDHPQYFVLVPPIKLMRILDENITAMTVMTYLLLPQMLERKRGAVINICSQISSLPPSPLLTAYTASMVYLRSFSECLELESSRRGITVQTLLPGFVANDGSTNTFFTPSPATYVRHALATLGVASTSCGYWPHSIQDWLCWCVPQWLWVWSISRLFRRHRSQSISRAKERGTEQFTRRRRSSVADKPTPGYYPAAIAQPAALRRVSGGLGLTLRRSPSPKRKVSAGSGGGTPLASSVGATPSRPLEPYPPLPLSQTLVGTSIPSPIPESPLTPAAQRFFPSEAQPPNTSTPLQAVAGVLNSGPPTQTQSLSSAVTMPTQTQPPSSGATVPRPASVPMRKRLPVRYSRVMVVPSLTSLPPTEQLSREDTSGEIETQRDVQEPKV